jgi:hypothetical protein
VTADTLIGARGSDGAPVAELAPTAGLPFAAVAGNIGANLGHAMTVTIERIASGHSTRRKVGFK